MAIDPNVSIADRMSASVDFFEMLEEGYEPDEMLKEADEKNQQSLKEQSEKLISSLRASQEAASKAIESLAKDVSDQSLLTAREEQLKKLTETQEELQRVYGVMKEKLTEGETTLEEQTQHRNVLTAKLIQLKDAAKKRGWPSGNPTTSRILDFGSKLGTPTHENAKK